MFNVNLDLDFGHDTYPVGEIHTILLLLILSKLIYYVLRRKLTLEFLIACDHMLRITHTF